MCVQQVEGMCVQQVEVMCVQQVEGMCARWRACAPGGGHVR